MLTDSIKIHAKIIELRGRLKLLLFFFKKIGKSFGTMHKKIEITPGEQEYIKNDILVVKEVLESVFTELL